MADLLQVSIPLRKFRKYLGAGRLSGLKMSFHPSKEVSEVKLLVSRTLRLPCFHPSKEVSEVLHICYGL